MRSNKLNLENFLLKGIWVGIFLILFTPLIVGRFGISYSELPKSVYFRSLTEFIFISYLILLIQRGREYLPQVKGRLLFFAVLGFVGVLGLGTLFSVNPVWSFWGTISRSQGLVTYLHFFALFLVLVSTVKTKENWIFLLQWLVFVSGISSFVGILQVLGIGSFYGTGLPERISGTLANPDFFGSYLVLNIFLGLFLLALRNKDKGIRVALASITGLNVVTLFLSGHRAGWVGAAVGFAFLGVVWFLRYSHKNKVIKSIFIYTALSLGIITSLLFLNRERLYSSQNYLARRVGSIFYIESALDSRMFVWEAVFKGWEGKPIFGWGLETSSFTFDKYRTFEERESGSKSTSTNIIYDRPHNKILEVASDTGVVGVFSYLFLFYSIFYLIFKHKKRWGSVPSLVLTSLFVAYFVQNLAIFDTISSYLTFFLLLGFINNNFAEIEKEDSRKQKKTSRSAAKFSKPSQEPALKLMVVILISLSIATFYVINLRNLQINLGIIQTQDLEKKDFSAALANYKQLSQQRTVLAPDIRWDVTEKLLLLLEVEQLKEFRKETTEVISGLVPVLEKDLKNPIKGYLRRYSLLARVYEVLYTLKGDKEALHKMEETAKRMVEFNEEFPDTYWYLGKVQIYRGNYEEGEAFFQEVLKFDLREQARRYAGMAGVYLFVGNKLRAGENLEKAVDAIYSYAKEKSLQSLGKQDLVWLQEQISLVDAAARFHVEELQNPEAAIEIYKKATLIYPFYKEVLQEKIDTIKEGP